MSYLELPIPNRSEHLWRYTPWSKVHPTQVDAVPEINSANVMFNGELVDAITNVAEISKTDISRAFLLESNSDIHNITIDDSNANSEIEVITDGEMNSCNLHFEVKNSGSIRVRLSGDSKWFGISITGNLHGNVNLSFAIVNDLSKNTTMLRCEDWDIARDSTLEYGELSMGGGRIKSDIRTYLKGTNSTLMQNIAVNCRDSRIDDHHIEIHHLSGHSNSSLTVKSACSDKGHAIGTGLLIIEENCDKSDAGQVFKNLLLSEKARAEAIPELEVLSDDVSAAHGAASSSVDLEQIHYMMTRGFSRDDAQTEIVEGFLISSFAKTKNEYAKEFLIKALSTNQNEWE